MKGSELWNILFLLQYAQEPSSVYRKEINISNRSRPFIIFITFYLQLDCLQCAILHYIHLSSGLELDDDRIVIIASKCLNTNHWLMIISHNLHSSVPEKSIYILYAFLSIQFAIKNQRFSSCVTRIFFI